MCIIIFLAKIVSEGMDQDHGRLRSFKSILFALAVCGLPTVLVMLQPDFGTAFVYICILVFILFIARIGWGYIVAAAGALAAGLPLAYFL